MESIILVGGGGHCKSVIESAESACLQIKGILDIPENVGKDVLSYKVIGTDDDIPKYVDECEFVVTVGFIKSPQLNILLQNKVIKANGKFATIVASTAHVSKYATIGKGVVIMHHAFVNAGAVIGFGSIINDFANIEHDVRIEQHCHISTGAMINGECEIGENTFIGSQSVVANCVKICSNCVIGAGTVVYKDINEPGTYVGNPVRKIK
jgi:sugar O-acyltransferase (sialic acid O-acetyltransferase NeuD family)